MMVVPKNNVSLHTARKLFIYLFTYLLTYLCIYPESEIHLRAAYSAREIKLWVSNPHLSASKNESVYLIALPCKQRQIVVFIASSNGQLVNTRRTEIGPQYRRNLNFEVAKCSVLN